MNARRVSVADRPRRRRAATFLFTDIEGSTRLIEMLDDQYPQVLLDHHRILRRVAAGNGGTDIGCQGDSLSFAFAHPIAALHVALVAQRALARHSWPVDTELKVRMGVHTGVVQSTELGWVGLALHQAARLCDAGHGGQVLVSGSTRQASDGCLPPAAALEPLGLYRLRNLTEPMAIFQMRHPALDGSFPSLRATPVPDGAFALTPRR